MSFVFRTDEAYLKEQIRPEMTETIEAIRTMVETVGEDTLLKHTILELLNVIHIKEAAHLDICRHFNVDPDKQV